MSEREAESVEEARLRQAEAYIEQEEGAAHRLSGRFKLVIAVIAAAMTLYHLNAGFFGEPAYVLRRVHLGFVFALIFLLFPLAARFRDRVRWWDFGFAAAGVATIAYLLVGGDDLADRGSLPEPLDVAVGVVLIALTLEATRRTTGWIMPAVALAFLAYAFAGPSLPPPWTHKGYGIDRVVGHLYINLEGIFGSALEVSSTLIILFTIFGAVLKFSGAGQFFIDFSFSATGGKRSSAGRAIVLSSFLLGGPSGSGVATTVTIGAVAWPMLRKAGYAAAPAGGLLAAGGLGAILSPPVLGAAAFLIAEFLKISYLDVIRMAVVPTLLYYFCLFVMVEMDAGKFAAREVESPVKKSLWELTRTRGFHFTSLISVVVLMLMGYSPELSVSAALIFAVLVSAFDPEAPLWPRSPLVTLAAVAALALAAWLGASQYGCALIVVALAVEYVRARPAWLQRLFDAAAGGSIDVLGTAATCAAAGIIVGVVTLTGLGLKFSAIVIAYAGGSLVLTAIYTALVVWIVGLAVPVTASYIICAVIAAPALIQLGVPDYAAHMFIFYYALLSEVSPPTALSPFAAAAITGGDPYKTTLQAWKYTMPAFLVPFVFVLDPLGGGLLLKPIPGGVLATIWICVCSAIGIAAFAGAAQGWLRRKIGAGGRALLALAGVLMLFPSLLDAGFVAFTVAHVVHAQVIGIALAVAVAAWQWKGRAPA